MQLSDSKVIVYRCNNARLNDGSTVPLTPELRQVSPANFTNAAYLSIVHIEVDGFLRTRGKSSLESVVTEGVMLMQRILKHVEDNYASGRYSIFTSGCNRVSSGVEGYIC